MSEDNPTSSQPIFPKVSVLHLEFEVPQRWTKILYAFAGKEDDPFAKMERTLQGSIDPKPSEEDVRLIGYTITDH